MAQIIKNRPSAKIGFLLILIYMAVAFPIQLLSGIPYSEWFASASNVWRSPILSLIAASFVMLMSYKLLKWDGIFKDKVTFKMSRSMNLAIAIFILFILVQLVGVQWNSIGLDLFIAIIVTGILVGFAEELLFRGFFLRAMREKYSNEAMAVIVTSIVFGVFHFPNAFLGQGLLVIPQIFITSVIGTVAYLFRRKTGSLVYAIIAHAMWDIALFFSGQYSADWLKIAISLMLIVQIVLGIIVLVSLYRGRNKKDLTV